MNKRIREFADQCYQIGPIGYDGWPEYTKFDEEKFAELILTDVYDILATYRLKVIFDDGIEYNCVHPIQAIQKHFRS